MELPVQSNQESANKESSLTISELFMSLQGEGMEICKPAIFVRLHNCPVHCPGCDTHYTWDGSEKGSRETLLYLEKWVCDKLAEFPGCGVVLTGGEPLLHFKNKELIWLLHKWKELTWVSLETSGFNGLQDSMWLWPALSSFFTAFSSVHLSPKITPCLHGKFSDEALCALVPYFFSYFMRESNKLALKFVVKDQLDIDAVEKFCCTFYASRHFPIYLMPYGQERDEILRISEELIPVIAKHKNWALSPRFHSILWGKERNR